MTFFHFIQYHNSVPIALGFVFLGATGALAATNPEAIYSATQSVVSVDNTYLAHVDLEAFTPRVEIEGVQEDAESYYVSYTLQTIDVDEGVWKDIAKKNVLQVDKRVLGATKDLGIYAGEQLGQLIDHEGDRLKEAQQQARAKPSERVVATVYGGLIGKFIDSTTEVLPGYVPVVVAPEPDLSQNTSVVAAVAAATADAPAAGGTSLSREEIVVLIQNEIAHALSAGAPQNSSGSPAPTPDQEPPIEPDQTSAPPPAETPPSEPPPAGEPSTAPEQTPAQEPAPEPEPAPTLEPAPEPAPATAPTPEPPSASASEPSPSE